MGWFRASSIHEARTSLSRFYRELCQATSGRQVVFPVFTLIHTEPWDSAGMQTIDLIQQVVDHGVEETADLDSKQAVYDSQNHLMKRQQRCRCHGK